MFWYFDISFVWITQVFATIKSCNANNFLIYQHNLFIVNCILMFSMMCRYAWHYSCGLVIIWPGKEFLKSCDKSYFTIFKILRYNLACVRIWQEVKLFFTYMLFGSAYILWKEERFSKFLWHENSYLHDIYNNKHNTLKQSSVD